MTPRPKRRFLRILSLLIALGLIAAACGTDSNGDDSDTASTDSADTDQVDDDGEEDEPEDDEPEDDEPEDDEPEDDEPEDDDTPIPVACDSDPTGWVLKQLATALDNNDAAEDVLCDQIEVIQCDTDGWIEMRMTGTEERVFSIDRIFRFHPSDDMEEPPGSRTNTPSSIQDPAIAKVTVLDQETHGQFIADEIAGMTGEAPALLEIDELFFKGSGMFRESAVAAMLDGIEAGGSGPTIVNMSFGTYGCDSTSAPVDLIAAMSSRGRQVTFVASAGNDETDQPRWPAALADDLVRDALATDTGMDLSELGEVWSVGSLPEDDAATRSCFSNYGNWVKLWLPGEEIAPGRGTPRTWSGTSFAAPQVAAWLSTGGDASDFARPTPPEQDVFEVEVRLSDGEYLPLTSFCAPNSEYSAPNVRERTN